jgi:hypothetical protein
MAAPYRDWIVANALGLAVGLLVEVAVDGAAPVGQETLAWSIASSSAVCVSTLLVSISQGIALRRSFPRLSLAGFVATGVLPAIVLVFVIVFARYLHGDYVLAPPDTELSTAPVEISNDWIYALLIAGALVVVMVGAVVSCLLQWTVMRRAMTPLRPWLIWNIAAAVAGTLLAALTFLLIEEYVLAPATPNNMSSVVIDVWVSVLALVAAFISGIGVARLVPKDA